MTTLVAALHYNTLIWNHTSHGSSVLLMQRRHGDVMHVSEFLNSCPVVDCHLLHLARPQPQKLLSFLIRFHIKS